MDKAGRPSTYNDDVLEKAIEYTEKWQRLGEAIPTVVGLCGYIERAKTTVYRWCGEEGKEPFRDIVRAIEELQEKTIINGAMRNDFNATISKLLLSKHGYTEKQEIDHTSDGEQISMTVEYVKADGKR